jgi:hypothetical protein
MAKRHALHSICPYFAMFPEDFVERHVTAHTDANDLVFDPFSGRGTTVFQSVLLDRRAAGVDINPVAACVSKAKADAPGLLEVLARINELEESFKDQKAEGISEFFEACFHFRTMNQILHVRQELKWTSNRIDCFIAAMSLGALHGESHRSELYFSNRMPRTISTKPEYSLRWWKTRGLVAPERNVFSILRKLARFRLADALPTRKGSVYLSDARASSVILSHLQGQVKLVVTSPPYVDVTDYAEDQWLRLWFLGGEPRPQTRLFPDDRHATPDNYWQFLTEVWAGIEPMMEAVATIVVRIGGKLSQEQLSNGLQKTLRLGMVNSTIVMRSNIQTSSLSKRQTNTFRPGTIAGVEHDFIFEVRRA